MTDIDKAALLAKEEYEQALALIGELMTATEGAPELAELMRLVALVEAYEDEHFQIAEPTPADAAEFRAEQEEAV